MYYKIKSHMKLYKILSLICLVIVATSLTGCSKILPITLMRPMDFIVFPFYYFGLAFVFALTMSLTQVTKAGKEKSSFKKLFWMNVFLTPLYGFISLLMRLVNSMD